MAYIIFLSFSQVPSEIDNIIIPILQTGELRLTQVQLNKAIQIRSVRVSIQTPVLVKEGFSSFVVVVVHYISRGLRQMPKIECMFNQYYSNE